MTPELHVHPSEDGARWLVDAAGNPSVLSSHGTAREAELAARRLAATCGTKSIYVHDAYHRVRCAAVRSRGWVS
jgi:hypothetical protein